MIKFVNGNFFDYDTDIRINTVNCVGVMGAGVALAFKNKYPDMFKKYLSVCRTREIAPGKPHVWKKEMTFDDQKPLTIINLPTKIHWRNNSEYEYIEENLKWLKNYLKDKEGKSVSLPALGCGHGGLDWNIVKKSIEYYLKDSPAEIFVFEPSVSKRIKKEIILNEKEKKELKKKYDIDLLLSNDKDYPSFLKNFTERDLFAKGTLSNLSDKIKSIALISSTKKEMEEKEEKIIKKIISSYLSKNSNKKFNLIVGSSAFEKKIVNSNKEQLFTIILPSGLKIFCEKNINKTICDNKNNLILSLGSPYNEFDKKEFISSVFARIFLSETVIFTTPKLDWIKKYKNEFNKMYNIEKFFINYKNIPNETKEILKSFSFQEIDNMLYSFRK